MVLPGTFNGRNGTMQRSAGGNAGGRSRHEGVRAL